MRIVHLKSVNDLAEWRGVARRLLLDAVPPEEVVWIDPALPHDLLGAEESVEEVTHRKVGVVPRRFLDWAEAGICHADPDRFDLLYRLLWRLQKDRELMGARDDPDVARLDRRVQAVRAETERMKRELVFEQAEGGKGGRRVAWFEPRHYVLERVARSLARRSEGSWEIATPCRTAMWDGEQLRFGEGRSNPERVRTIGTQSQASARTEDAMVERQVSGATPRQMRRPAGEPTEAPDEHFGSLEEAREAVDECRRCPLYEMATQAVFGEGPETAEIMFVGEQPGDQEDLAGKPFVGPAGKVFDAAMAEAGLDRERTYVTNAVKHFKFVPRGKKRLHQRPNAGEIKACRFWLNLERQFVKPRLIVAMGATAVASLAGSSTTLGSVRGKVTVLEDGTRMYATVHPSFLLRMPDREQAKLERERFVEDLRAVGRLVAE